MPPGRLLYLGFAFPPGMQALHPELNPAGHRFETRLIAELRTHFDLRTVGVLPLAIPPELEETDLASGVRHALTLADRPPHVLNRWRSLLKLRRQFANWNRAGWRPDAVLVYNLSPIYNAFILGLCRARSVTPKRILMLLDSAQLGRDLPWRKRLRYRLKPLIHPDAGVLPKFHACIGLSPEVRKYLDPAVPFLWMPGACPNGSFGERDPGGEAELAQALNRPVRFGYFGALAAHAGILEFAEIFLASPLHASLRVCGYGKLSDVLARLAKKNPRLEFRGLLPNADDCLEFGRSCDILVNPRPATHGNGNNFPSKIFEYACCGRAILSTRLSGVDTVLGEDAWFFDADRFGESLAAILPQVAAIPIGELHRRGRRLQQRVTAEYHWQRQGQRIHSFIASVIKP